jgi:hypothetical protein
MSCWYVITTGGGGKRTEVRYRIGLDLLLNIMATQIDSC